MKIASQNLPLGLSEFPLFIFGLPILLPFLFYREISPHSSLKTIGQHLLLKCSALALITPFYSASLVETVQSEITSEKPGIFDIFKEGLFRLLSFTQPQTGRMLPVWLLVVPTVAYGVMSYIIGNVVSTLASKCLKSLHRRENKVSSF